MVYCCTIRNGDNDKTKESKMLALIAASIFTTVALIFGLIEKIRLVSLQRRTAHYNRHISLECRCNGPL